MVMTTPDKQETDHSIVVAVRLKQFGTDAQCERTIKEVQRLLSVALHQDVEIAAFGFTTSKNSTFTKNGTSTVLDLVTWHLPS